MAGEDHLRRRKINLISFLFFLIRITSRDHQRKHTNFLAGNLKCLLRYMFYVTLVQGDVYHLKELEGLIPLFKL